MFFFFQAEDGIRDTSVTGVQTCALPIYHWEMEKLEVSAGMVNLTLNCGSGNCPCVACGTASLQNCGQLLCRAGAQISREGHRFLCVRYRAGLEQPLIRCTKRLV